MPVRVIIAIVSIIPLLVGGVYYAAFYPPVVLKRATQSTLDSFSAAVATKDRAKISDQLKRLLTDSAHIRLEVTYMKLFQQNNPAIVQEFGTPALFITFIDNILYSLENYSFDANLTHFELAPDKKTADVAFHSIAQAEGNSSFDGTRISLHFVADTTCHGHVLFDYKIARLSDAVCILQLTSLPKNGEEKKPKTRQ